MLYELGACLGRRAAPHQAPAAQDFFLICGIRTCWAMRIIGPPSYSKMYGDETSVVRMHSGNGPHEDMDRRAIACFDQALIDVGLSAHDGLGQVLHDYFAWATTTTMSRYHSEDDVPDGLGLPRWSWDGLVDP